MKAAEGPLPLVDEDAPRRRRGLGTAITLAFFAGLLWLLSRLAHRLPWGDVAGALQAYRAPTLLAAAALVAASFGLYAAYELLCRRYAGHRLSKRLTAAIGMVAQALNLSLGSWIGGIGGRLRLYTRFGQAPELVARVYGMALLTNWSGYLLLAGGVFSARQIDLPEGWRTTWILLGVQMVDTGMATQPDEEAVQLGPADVPEMLDLVSRTRPGPFLLRTVELGSYLGIRRDGALIAMAGERMHPPGYTEISAVCTDPDHQGSGLASRLMRAVAHGIRGRGEVPILHASSTNHTAIRLYEKLGFAVRREFQFVGFERPTQ